MIRTLRENFDEVNIIIPFWAKSAATLLALGGSSIIMDEFGEGGPLDAQIGKASEDGPYFERESALNDEHSLNRVETRFKEMYEAMYLRIYQHNGINIHKTELSKQLLKHLSQFYDPLLRQINPYKLGEKRRILDIGGQYANRIMSQFGTVSSVEIRRLLQDYLVNACPDHGYVVDYAILSRFLGNKVKKTSEISPQYQEAITDLSLLFIENTDEDETIIDVFYKPAITNQKTPDHANDQTTPTPEDSQENIGLTALENQLIKNDKNSGDEKERNLKSVTAPNPEAGDGTSEE